MCIGRHGVVGVYLKLPSASAETCPTGLPSMMMATVQDQDDGHG